MTGQPGFSDHERPLKCENIIYRKLEEEYVLYDMESDKIFGLNRVASIIWDYCDGRNSLSGIAKKIVGEFDENESVILDDVREVVEKFRQLGLLQDDRAE